MELRDSTFIHINLKRCHQTWQAGEKKTKKRNWGFNRKLTELNSVCYFPLQCLITGGHPMELWGTQKCNPKQHGGWWMLILLYSWTSWINYCNRFFLAFLVVKPLLCEVNRQGLQFTRNVLNIFSAVPKCRVHEMGQDWYPLATYWTPALSKKKHNLNFQGPFQGYRLPEDVISRCQNSWRSIAQLCASGDEGVHLSGPQLISLGQVCWLPMTPQIFQQTFQQDRQVIHINYRTL